METGRADALKPGCLSQRKPLVKPPIRAVAVKAAITFTMGGLQIDERARALACRRNFIVCPQVPESRAYTDIDRSVVAIGSDYRQMPVRGLHAAGNEAGNVSPFQLGVISDFV